MPGRFTLDRGLSEVKATRFRWKIPGTYKARDGTIKDREVENICPIVTYDPAPIRGLKPPPRDSTTRIPLSIMLPSGDYAWCDVTFNDLLKVYGLVHPDDFNLFAIMLGGHAQHFVVDVDGDAAKWPQLIGKEVEIETELRALFVEFYATQFGATPGMAAWRADRVPAPASGVASKMSIHVNHPGVTFKQPRDLREFVLRWVRWIVQTHPESLLVRMGAAASDLVQADDFNKASPIDTSVYNKDRNMRLSHSRKPGKLPLVPMDPSTTPEDALWSSLVCYSMPRDPAEWHSYKDGEHYEVAALEPASKKRRVVGGAVEPAAKVQRTDSTSEVVVMSAETCVESIVDNSDYDKATICALPEKTDDSETTKAELDGEDVEVTPADCVPSFMTFLPAPTSADVKLLVGSLSRHKRLFGAHDDWRNVVWAVKAVCGEDAGYAIVEEWTKIWEDKTQQKSVLAKTWKSGQSGTFNVGSLWRWVKEDTTPAKYKALWKQINPPVVMNAAKRAAEAAGSEKAPHGDEKEGDAPLASALAVNVFDMSIQENFAFMQKAFNVLSTSMSEDALCCYFQRAGLSPEQIAAIRRDHRLTAHWSQQELPEEAATATLRVTQREALYTLFSRLPDEFVATNSLVLNSDDAAITCRRDLGMAELFKTRYQDRMIFKPSGAECYVWNQEKALYDELTPDFLHTLIANVLMGVVERMVAVNEWQKEHYGERREVTPGSLEDERWQARAKRIKEGKRKWEKLEEEKSNKRKHKKRKTGTEEPVTEQPMSQTPSVEDTTSAEKDPDIMAFLQAECTAERFEKMWTNKLFVLRTLQLKLCEKTTVVCNTVIQQIKNSMRDETIDERMNVAVKHEIPIMDGLLLNCKDKTVRPRTMHDLYTDIFPVHYHRSDSTDTADVVGFEMAHKYLRELAREGTGMTDAELKSLERDDKAEYDRLMQERTERLEVLCSRAGYTMTGEHIVKELQIFHGASGNNGKTGLSKLIDGIMGPTFCYNPETSALFSVEKDTGKQTSWKIPLRYARCALIAEPPRGLAINDTFVKIVAGGGDKQKAREVFGRQKDSRSFISPTKWWVFSNFPLKMRDSDKFSRKRANIIPALAQFAEDDVEGQRFVKDILDKYKDYVFSVFVDYAHRFYTDETTMGVTLPPVGKSILEYKNKVMSGNEPWLCFLRCCEVGKEAEITITQFWQNWELWKKEQKIVEKVDLSDADVKERFEAHCGEPRKAASREDRANKVIGAKRSMLYYGIGPLLKDWKTIAKGGPS